MDLNPEPKKEEYLNSAIEVCIKHNILLPTFKMLDNPKLIPQKVKEELKNVGIDDLNPLNLFRISWNNEPLEKGGQYNDVPNYIEIPPEISGIKPRIIMLLGAFFPTGSHKVGASFGPLVTRITSGRFDPKKHKSLWPSTGNYCRGGVFNAALMHSPAVAILPENMSKERFDWLNSINAEIVKAPSTESSIKEVLDISNKLAKEGEGKIFSLNQFSDFTNPIWHYWCTGRALEKVFNHVAKPGQRLAGVHLCEGSGGTLSGSTFYLKQKFPLIKIAAGEAFQCPTLLLNGYGGHKIEGIGDAFVPWILNMKNIDLIVEIDDQDVMKVVHLFNQPAGIAYLKEKGVPEETIKKLNLLGISSVANLLGCIKEAKYYEFNERDIIVSVCTDSMKLYQSRLKERSTEFTRDDAIEAYAQCLMGQRIEHCSELTYIGKKKCHQLKYFTWVEQQGKNVKELNDQWFDDNYWDDRMSEKVIDMYDSWINEFNRRTGLGENFGM